MSAIDLLSGKAKHFATHAFNKYSDEELNQLQEMGQPDQVELDAWEITADEWYSALQAAIADRLIGEENRL